ncbi:MAG: hypothetical protein ACNA8L_03580 [Luteolibacter sp.]
MIEEPQLSKQLTAAERRRFGTALVANTRKGKTLYRNGLDLLDMKRESSFKEFARNLDFPL